MVPTSTSIHFRRLVRTTHEGYRPARQSESLGYRLQFSLGCSPLIGRFNHPHDKGTVVFSAHNGRRCTRSNVDFEAHTPSLTSSYRLCGSGPTSGRTVGAARATRAPSGSISPHGMRGRLSGAVDLCDV